jgi:hypothetical protein
MKGIMTPSPRRNKKKRVEKNPLGIFPRGFEVTDNTKV